MFWICLHCVLKCSLMKNSYNNWKCLKIKSFSLLKTLHDQICALRGFAVLCRYVPALRPLRQQAFLLSFPQTQPSRLTQRLAEVSAGTELKAPEPRRLVLTRFVVCRSPCGRAWRPTPARWCACARRRTTISGRASTHCRWRAEGPPPTPLTFSMLLLLHGFFTLSVCAQFLHGRGLKRVDLKTIQCVSVGQKDQNKGLFHLWQEIFQLPRTKR